MTNMVKEWKKAKVEELKLKFKSAKGVFFTDFRGLTVSEALKLRRRLWPLDTEFRVVKNSYLTHASQGTNIEELNPYFRGQTAVLFCYRDPLSSLKCIFQFINENPAIKMKAGMVSGRLLTPQEMEQMSKLPSQDVMRHILVISIAYPFRAALHALSWPMYGLVLVLIGILEKRRTASP